MMLAPLNAPTHETLQDSVAVRSWAVSQPWGIVTES